MKCPKCNTVLYLSVDARMGERYYCPNCQNWTKPKFTEERPAGVQ